MKTSYKQQLGIILDMLPTVFKTEYRFHHKRRWRFDFADVENKIAVEYEGLPYQTKHSRHTNLKGFTNDCEKYNEAQLFGWQVYRFTAKMIQDGIAEEQLFQIYGLL